LYQRGDTLGTFQFESPGMQKYLKELKPDKFEDLIAMNALYRPGPMEYIPLYIKRKHGLEDIIYDIPELEDYLKDTYGITVYQEQVMLLSQSLGNFSKGKADMLRKAMGKKNLADLMKLKSEFMEGVNANNLNVAKCEKIWKDWEAFASYAFNKSHSTCYAFVAYQTAYLKAHYPSEYMAAVLSNNMNNIDKLSFMMEECKRMKISVLCPDINESEIHFSVNKKGQIRFGLSAIKGVGGAPALNIIEERQANGPYKGIFDLTSRCNLRILNKRTLEALVKGGAFEFDESIHKAQYLNDVNGISGIDTAIKFGNAYKAMKDSTQNSLFGEMNDSTIPIPQLPKAENYTIMEECQFEKEVIGIFIKNHPLDTYQLEYKTVVNCKLNELKEPENIKDNIKANIIVAGIVVKSEIFTSKKNIRFHKFTLQDYEGEMDFYLSDKLLDEYSKIIDVNEFLLVKCAAVFQDYSQKYRLNILQMHRMEYIRKNYFTALNLLIDVNNINEGALEDLDNILDKYTGEKSVEFNLSDVEKKYNVKTYSSDKKVNICDELILDLNKINVLYKIVTKN
jgi:DNA polymerase III subunit alpha